MLVKTYKKSLIISIILFAIFIIILINQKTELLSFRELILFLIIGLISITSIIKELKYASYSLSLMHWLFILFFFFIAPIIQISNGFNSWGIIQSEATIFNSCVYVLIWCIFYKIASSFANRKRKNDKYKFDNRVEYEINNKTIILITGISILCCILLINNIGLTNMFSRSTASISFDGSNAKMMSLLLGNITRVVITYSTAISFLYHMKQKKVNSLVLLIINLIVLLIGCFPTALARNSVGTIYLGLLVILLFNKKDKIKNSLFYVLIFLITFVLVFPTINVYRRNTILNANVVDTFNEVANNIGNNYLSEDYDAFTVIGNVKTYTDYNGITNGKQLEGALLFFVPRSIWNNKPYGSGQIVYKYLGKQYTNISCPLLAEGYINFGLIGIIIFAIIFGYVSKLLDKKYWERKNYYSYYNVLYPFLLPSYFFLLRGDLISTWSYMFTYIIVFYILNFIVKKRVNKS